MDKIALVTLSKIYNYCTFEIYMISEEKSMRISRVSIKALNLAFRELGQYLSYDA